MLLIVVQNLDFQARALQKTHYQLEKQKPTPFIIAKHLKGTNI